MLNHSTVPQNMEGQTLSKIFDTEVVAAERQYVHHRIAGYHKLHYYNNTGNTYRIAMVKYYDNVLPESKLPYIRLQVPTLRFPIFPMLLQPGECIRVHTTNGAPVAVGDVVTKITLNQFQDARVSNNPYFVFRNLVDIRNEEN